MANKICLPTNPAKEVAEVLEACHWDKLVPGLWQKEKSKILIDEFGIFLYRLKFKTRWVRTHGICHQDLWPQLPERTIRFEDPSFKLDLLTG